MGYRDKVWLPYEERFLRANAERFTLNELLYFFPEVSKDSLRNKLVSLGLPFKGSRSTYKQWTTTEVNYLKKHYPQDGSRKVAKALGRTPQTVYAYAKYLGIAYRPLPPTPYAFIQRHAGLGTATLAGLTGYSPALIQSRLG